LAAQGTIERAVVLDSFANEQCEVRAAILDAIDSSAPEWLRDLALKTVRDSAAANQGEAFEAVVRIGTTDARAAALRWLGLAKGAQGKDAWCLLERALPAPDIVELLVHSPYGLRKAALRELVGIPVAQLAALAIDGDTHTFFLIRQRRDFGDAPPE